MVLNGLLSELYRDFWHPPCLPASFQSFQLQTVTLVANLNSSIRCPFCAVPLFPCALDQVLCVFVAPVRKVRSVMFFSDNNSSEQPMFPFNYWFIFLSLQNPPFSLHWQHSISILGPVRNRKMLKNWKPNKKQQIKILLDRSNPCNS